MLLSVSPSASDGIGLLAYRRLKIALILEIAAGILLAFWIMAFWQELTLAMVCVGIGILAIAACIATYFIGWGSLILSLWAVMICVSVWDDIKKKRKKREEDAEYQKGMEYRREQTEVYIAGDLSVCPGRC